MPAEYYLEDTVEHLQTLAAVRERCNLVLELVKEGQSSNFNVEITKLPEAAELIIKLIIRDYGSVEEEHVMQTLERIPIHGRWRHFGDHRIQGLIRELEIKFKGDTRTITRAIIDLFMVAVLLDAGAGDAWKYFDKETGEILTRSEGLAVASLNMYKSGKFSSAPTVMPFQVDSIGLLGLTKEDIIKGFQVEEDNPLLGVNGRLELLHRLGNVLEVQLNYFPPSSNSGLYRPGNLLDYLLTNQSGHHPDNTVHIDTLWKAIIEGLSKVWPESSPSGEKLGGGLTTTLGVGGDVWKCDALNGHLIPFHKLSQWLTYSIMEPITKLQGIKFVGTDKMTGLAEYRNGGLFVDLGIITLKEKVYQEGLNLARATTTIKPEQEEEMVPIFKPDSQVIIEWRALTVALLDQLAILLRERLQVSKESLPLVKILEAGTWKAGREISKQLRPSSGGPPIAIVSDGTLF